MNSVTCVTVGVTCVTVSGTCVTVVMVVVGGGWGVVYYLGAN